MSAVHHHPLRPDSAGYDLAQDSRWDLIDPSFYGPDPSVTDLHRGSHVRPALTRRGPTPMNALAGHVTGLDGRPASVPSSQPSALPLGAGTPHDEVTLGGGPSWGEPLAEPATSPSSSLVAGREDLEDVSSARRSPGAA